MDIAKDLGIEGIEPEDAQKKEEEQKKKEEEDKK